MHEETRPVSRFASMAVAAILVTEVQATTSSAGGLDWDLILRHYLRYPDARPSMWESQVLAFVRANGRDPTYDEVTDRVPQVQAVGADGLARLRTRRAGGLTAELEQRYQALEERVDRFQLLLRF